jgi:hypothetical protein
MQVTMMLFFHSYQIMVMHWGMMYKQQQQQMMMLWMMIYD